MSLLSVGKSILGSMNNSRERTVDPLARLRYVLETMATSKKLECLPQIRTEILTELYDAFWGSNINFFITGVISTPPMQSLLSEMQDKFPSSEFLPGRPCGHIFLKGECCYRCK